MTRLIEPAADDDDDASVCSLIRWRLDAVSRSA
jgi:hypothetical protein